MNDGNYNVNVFRFLIIFGLVAWIAYIIDTELLISSNSTPYENTYQPTTPINTYPYVPKPSNPSSLYQVTPTNDRRSNGLDTTDDAYDEGYDKGYRTGVEDGRKGHYDRYSYNDDSSYFDDNAERYQEGYESSYVNGYYDGYSYYNEQEEQKRQEQERLEEQKRQEEIERAKSLKSLIPFFD